MKIFVLTSETAATSGWGRYSADLLHALSRYGVQADTVTAGILPDPLDYRRNFLLAPWYAWRLRERARACDAIHAFVEPYACVAYWLALFARKPYYVTAHGTYALLPFSLSLYRRLFHRRAFARAQRIVCVSDYTRRRLAAFGFDNLSVINNGIAFDAFSFGAAPTSEKEDLILSVGAIKHRKGYHVALEAFARARKDIPTLRYCIVGDRGDAAYVRGLMERACALGVHDAVEFHESVSDEDLRQLYRRARALVLTPVSEGMHFEGFGLVYLEANASGLPVIGTKETGAEDAIRDGETGYLVPQNDVPATAAAIVRILQNPEKSRVIGDAGIAWARGHDWNVIAPHYAALYTGGAKPASFVLSAAYGMGNLGDEAICEAVLTDLFALRPAARVTALAYDRRAFWTSHPQWQGRIRVESMQYHARVFRHPGELLSLARGATAILLSDVFVWGGGGLVRDRTTWLKTYLMPLRLAQRWRKRIFIWCIGVDVISNSEVRRLLAAVRPDVCAVRDEQSLSNLVSAAPHLRRIAKLVRDPAFLLGDIYPSARSTSERARVGLNVTYWKADLSERNRVEAFADALARALAAAHTRRDFTLVYLPTAPQKDEAVFEMLKQRLPDGIAIERPPVATPGAYVSALSSLDAFVGMRLHSLIMASSVPDLPLITIAYDEKVEALQREARIPASYSIADILAAPERAAAALVAALETPEKLLVNFRDFRENAGTMRCIAASHLP